MSGARLMQILASLARRSPLRTLHTICETQHQISTRKLEQYLESIGDELAGFAFNLRQDYDQLHAANRRLEAELAALKADRDDQYNMKVKAREQRDKVTELLKAKAAVPDGLLDRIDSAITAFTSGRASMHVPPEANDVDMVLAECWKMVKAMLAAAPAQQPEDPLEWSRKHGIEEF